MNRIILIGEAAAELSELLADAGYKMESLPSSAIEPGRLASADLFILSPLNEAGQPIYGRFREMLGGRRASVILAISDREAELPESWIGGINDVIFWPVEKTRVLETVRRQLSVPTRREASSLARVREPGSPHLAPRLGSAVNVSLHGLLLEIEGEYGVGDALEIEFFLQDDPEPITASGVVRRSTFDPTRFRRAYGVAFTRLEADGRARLARYCESWG